MMWRLDNNFENFNCVLRNLPKQLRKTVMAIKYKNMLKGTVYPMKIVSSFTHLQVFPTLYFSCIIVILRRM